MQINKKNTKKRKFITAAHMKVCEISEYRTFIFAQVQRNLYGRYKNSYLGFTWNFVTPLIYIVLCYILFKELKTSTIDNYILFISSGVFAYSMLVSGITGGGNLFIGNSGMIKKMYFPREILAIISAISASIIMIIGYTIVGLIIILTGHEINFITIPFVILVLLCTFVFHIGCSLLLGTITVYVRDIQHLLNSITIVFFICTPIRISISEATGVIANIYAINPLTYFIEPLHQLIYYGNIPDLLILSIMILLSIVIFFSGYVVFCKFKHGFVERL